MNPAGYLVKHHAALIGERGSHFDYVLAGNGIWVEAEGPLLAARVLVAPAEIRGLPPLYPRLVLRHGRIPGALFDTAVGLMEQDPEQEMYVAFYWTGEEYRLWIPNQQQGKASVEYDRKDGTVLDLHSHNSMPAYFSGTDDRDEMGLQVYGVVGNLPNTRVAFRFGVYGYHQTARWGDVFDGASPSTATEPEMTFTEDLGWSRVPAPELPEPVILLSLSCKGPWAIEHASCPQDIYQAWDQLLIFCPCACHVDVAGLAEADKKLTRFADEHLRAGLEPRESGFIASVLELRAALRDAGHIKEGEGHAV